jgi:hypothetical protein
MRSGGDQESGFSADYDTSSQTVCVRAWGFWGADIASSFVRSVAAECSAATRPIRLLVDVTRLLPQRNEGQAAFGDLMTSVTMHGDASVGVVFSNTITKMQLLRLAKERGVRNWAYFSSNLEARAALARPQTPRR